MWCHIKETFFLTVHFFEDVPVAKFMYLVFTRMPSESYRRRLKSLSCLCDVFPVCLLVLLRRLKSLSCFCVTSFPLSVGSFKATQVFVVFV